MTEDCAPYFVCKSCGQNWSPKSVYFKSDLCDVERMVDSMEEKHLFKKAFSMDCPNLNTTEKFAGGVFRVCNSCKVFKHRMALKNPFLAHLTTGSLPDFVKNSKHNKDTQFYSITYTHFWISEYCIRLNCLKKAQFYGFCKTCFNIYKEDPSMIKMDMDTDINFDTPFT